MDHLVRVRARVRVKVRVKVRVRVRVRVRVGYLLNRLQSLLLGCLQLRVCRYGV